MRLTRLADPYTGFDAFARRFYSLIPRANPPQRVWKVAFMTNAGPASEAREGGAISWTCNRCEVTVSFSPEVKQPRLPPTWVRQEGELYCLSCRRDLAADAGLEGLDEDDIPSQRRLQLRSHARIEFEIRRDPDRPDSLIAKSCGTSTFSVRKARARLGLDAPDTA